MASSLSVDVRSTMHQRRALRRLALAGNDQDFIASLDSLAASTQDSSAAAAVWTLAIELRVQTKSWAGFSKALAKCLRALSKAPPSEEVEQCRGLVLLARAIRLSERNRTAEAHREFLKMASKYEGYFRHMALTYLGIEAYRAGDTESAIDCLGHSAETMPDELLRLRGYARELYDLVQREHSPVVKQYLKLLK